MTHKATWEGAGPLLDLCAEVMGCHRARGAFWELKASVLRAVASETHCCLTDGQAV